MHIYMGSNAFTHMHMHKEEAMEKMKKKGMKGTKESTNQKNPVPAMAPSDHLGIKALCRAIPEALVAVRGHQDLGPGA